MPKKQSASSEDDHKKITPVVILEQIYKQAIDSLDSPIIEDSSIRNHVQVLTRNNQNRAGVRVLLSSLLAKIDNPHVDIRKPYTKIGGNDVYSGRSYDEHYVTAFIHKYKHEHSLGVQDIGHHWKGVTLLEHRL